MALEIQRVQYFYTSVPDRSGQAFTLLSELAAGDVNLLAFAAIPMGPNHAQLTLFPNNGDRLMTVAERAGLVLQGPNSAILVRGDDRLGALADIHSRLAEAKVHVFASNGVTDGRSNFGYVIYIPPDEIDAGMAALGA